ncbi:MAG: hypothetical protein R3F37_19135 [Candidatus Competibacteraceae bacterium]
MEGDKHQKVQGDHNQKVNGTLSMHADMDIQEKAGMNYALDAGMEIHLNAGMTAVVEAGTSLTLKVVQFHQYQFGRCVHLRHHGHDQQRRDGRFRLRLLAGCADRSDRASREAATDQPGQVTQAQSTPIQQQPVVGFGVGQRLANRPGPALSTAAQSGTFCEIWKRRKGAMIACTERGGSHAG